MQQNPIVDDTEKTERTVDKCADQIEVFMSTGPIQRQGVTPRQIQNPTEQDASALAKTKTEDATQTGDAAALGGPLTLSDLPAQNTRGAAGTGPNLQQLSDSFSIKDQQAATAQDPVQKAQTAAVEKFQDRLVDILGAGSGPALTAEQMALGKMPSPNGQAGGEISPAQQKELASASKDLLMEMPIASLSPSATAYAKAYVETRGIDTTNFESKTIKDLEPVAAELAEKLVDNMKDNSPAAYYGLAAAGAVAVGAYGYSQGSDALKKLGIKPKVDTKLFNDQVTARAEASWGKKLKDPNLTLGADGTFKVSPTANLRVGASASVGGPSVSEMGVKGAEASIEYKGEQNSAAAQAKIGANGQFESANARIATDRRVGPGGRDHLAASMQARLANSGFAGIDGSARYQRNGSETFTASGNFSTDATMNITKANAEARLAGTDGHVGMKMNYDRPSDVLGYSLDAKYQTPGGLSLSGDANFDRRFEMERGRLGISQTIGSGTFEGMEMQVNGNFGRAGRFEGLGAEAKYQNDAWRLGAGVQHNAIEDRTMGSLSVGYEARKDLDFQVRGSLDTQGNSQIGAGFTWRF